jgi:hypothetical protein
MNRRIFLKDAAMAGTVAFLAPWSRAFAGDAAASYFGLHPFIEAHPEAVFIKLTDVASKTDTAGKLAAGSDLASRIFTLRDTPGFPLSNMFTIKPNITFTRGTGLTHAIITDPNVTEGFVEGMKNLGIQSDKIYARDAWDADQPGIGYKEMAERTGIHYSDDTNREVTWKECSDGVLTRRTQFLGPYLYPDTYLINIAKFKAHGMGVTLCLKNLQGMQLKPHLFFCSGIQESIAADQQPDARRHIDHLYAKHLADGLPRWDTPNALNMEEWVQRSLDSYSLIKDRVGINIVEGVYGQNGDGFKVGPRDGLPEVFMTNLFIFGKNTFNVDIIGHWLGGHEPGNFGLFHIARERGLSDALNPKNIPVYLWEDKGPRKVDLESLTRYPLLTYYLQKSGEEKFHMVDEPFQYAEEEPVSTNSGGTTPGLRMLGQTRTMGNGFSAVFEYRLPAASHVSVDVLNNSGERIAMLTDAWKGRGIHPVEWNLREKPAGDYYVRFTTNAYEEVKKFSLLTN